MIDINAAMLNLLKSEPTITDLTDRIYIGEIPRDEIETLPSKVIVLVASGGLMRNMLLPLISPRYQLWCVGKTYYEAGLLDSIVIEVLRHIVRRTINGVLIHSISWDGGPFMVRDDLTGWPSFWRSIVVYSDARPTNGG